MLKKIFIFSFLLIIVCIPNVLSCAYNGQTDKREGDDCDYTSNPQSFDWTNGDLATVNDPSAVAQNIQTIPVERRSELTASQLSQTSPSSMGNLGDYDRNALNSALTAQGYKVTLLGDNLNGVTIEGDDIVLPGGSRVNAKAGQKSELEVAGDGSVKSFTDDRGFSFYNAQGVNYNGLALTIASADSVSWYGPTLTKIIDFSGESGTFSVKSADRVIVETMTFDKIVNSVFKVSSGSLVAASIECTKNNSQTRFPNLVAGTSAFITSNCDDNEKYHVDYRENANEIVFNLSANMTLTFQGARANITFNASENASLIIKPNGVFAVKNGILSYITETFTEQLQGNCPDYSSVDIDFEKGFLKTTLLPFNNPQTGVFICPGARYNRIYKEKENSYSIYNIGKSAYYLVFDKNLQIFNDLITSNKNRENYGFITENISLNGNIEYDRYPEKNIFPAISVEEYNSLPLDWKKVYAGYDPAMRTAIAGQNKVSISSKNYNGTDDILAEINSGYFNIKQIGSSRFAKFNKNMTYPDYVSEFRYNNEPVIRIENKKLIEITDDKMTILYSPNTDESAKFLEWLKLKLTLKELSDVIGRIFGTNNLQVEVS